MALALSEHYRSGDGETGQQPYDVLVYAISGFSGDGINNDVTVKAFGDAGISAAYNGKYRGPVHYERLSNGDTAVYGWWLATATYITPQEFRQTGTKSLCFNTAGGQQHITFALEHVQTYIDGGADSDDSDGILNPSDDPGQSPAGLDVDVAALNFQVTSYVTASSVTNAYLDTLFSLSNTVNDSSWSIPGADGLTKTFSAGEVRFLGAQGAMRAHGDWEIAYNFSALPNVTGLSFGPITGVNKKGWEYISVSYTPSTSGTPTRHTSIPKVVRVDKIYPEADWSGLII